MTEFFLGVDGKIHEGETRQWEGPVTACGKDVLRPVSANQVAVLDDSRACLVCIPPDIRRFDGNAICPGCEKRVYEHALDQDVLDYNQEPFVHRLCDGTLAKT